MLFALDQFILDKFLNFSTKRAFSPRQVPCQAPINRASHALLDGMEDIEDGDVRITVKK